MAGNILGMALSVAYFELAVLLPAAATLGLGDSQQGGIREP
jgi:hypothetical protein